MPSSAAERALRGSALSIAMPIMQRLGRTVRDRRRGSPVGRERFGTPDAECVEAGERAVEVVLREPLVTSDQAVGVDFCDDVRHPLVGDRRRGSVPHPSVVERTARPETWIFRTMRKRSGACSAPSRSNSIRPSASVAGTPRSGDRRRRSRTTTARGGHPSRELGTAPRRPRSPAQHFGVRRALAGEVPLVELGERGGEVVLVEEHRSTMRPSPLSSLTERRALSSPAVVRVSIRLRESCSPRTAMTTGSAKVNP